MQEAVLRFFDDLDEEVVRLRHERIAEALRPFFAYIERTGIEQLGDLTVDHIETFIVQELPVVASEGREAAEAWHGITRFVTWCKRRRYAPKLAKTFARKRSELRWVALGK